MSYALFNLTRADAVDSPFSATPRNVEIATAYALRAAAGWKRRLQPQMDPVSLEEAAGDAVLRAAGNYDPNNARKANFFTYAHSVVHGALLEEDRKQRKYRAPLSLESSCYCGPGRYPDTQRHDFSQATLNEVLKDAAPSLDEQMTEGDFLRDVIERVAPLVLDERERGILILRYLGGMKQCDVATHYGVTPGRIHQIEDELMEKVRTFLKSESSEADK